MGSGSDMKSRTELFLESEKNCRNRLKGAEMTEKAILEIFSDYT